MENLQLWLYQLSQWATDLVNHQLTHLSPLTLVVVGHAQAHPLLLELQRLQPALVARACPCIDVISPAEVQELQAALADVDVLITHQLPSDYRDGIGLDTATLQSHLPRQATTLLIADLQFEGLHPWIGYAHDPDGRLPELRAEGQIGRSGQPVLRRALFS